MGKNYNLKHTILFSEDGTNTFRQTKVKIFWSLKHANLFGQVQYGKLCRFKKIIKHTSLFSQDGSQNSTLTLAKKI